MSSLFPWILLFSAGTVHGGSYRAATNILDAHGSNQNNLTESNVDCPGDQRCGCDRMFEYDESTKSCELNHHATRTMLEKYNTHEKLKRQSDFVFSGAIVAAVLFITLASTCTIVACVFCCHMNRSDNTLKKQLKEMAARSGHKLSLHSKRSPPNLQEACPIIMEESLMM